MTRVDPPENARSGPPRKLPHRRPRPDTLRVGHALPVWLASRLEEFAGTMRGSVKVHAAG
jgi:hypothetical protein